MDNDNNSACKVVAKGCVGECDSSNMLIYKCEAEISKMMVVRREESGLCPDTGAIAMIVINGKPVASGNITREGASISCEAMPGDIVVVVVQAIPLFNQITCFRLGELYFSLSECDLVK